jgi:organic radical activating enzyme
MFVVGNEAFDVYGRDYKYEDIKSDIPELAGKLYAALGYCAYTSQEYDVIDEHINFTQLPSFNSRKFELMFTPTCNLHCSYCLLKATYPEIEMKEKYTYYNREKAHGYFDLLKPRNIALLGGEPTLFPDEIADVFNLLDEMGAPESTNLTVLTNGTNKKVISELTKLNPRTKWLISVSSDVENAAKKHLTHKDFADVDRSNIIIRLLLGNNISQSVIDSDFDEYLLLRPMHDLTDEYWTDHIDSIVNIMNYPRIYEETQRCLQPLDTYGAVAGCTFDQLFEELSGEDDEYHISTCIIGSETGEFEKRTQTKDQKFTMNPKIFSPSNVAALKEDAYKKYTNRNVFYQHCALAKVEYTRSAQIIDTIEGTIVLKSYIEAGMLDSLKIKKKAYTAIHNNIIQVPDLEKRELIIEPIYTNYDNRHMTLPDYNSFAGLFGLALRDLYFDGCKADGDYSWKNSSLPYSDVYMYSDQDKLKASGKKSLDLVGLFVPGNRYISYLVFGFKQDVEALLAGKALSHSNTLNNSFFTWRSK